MNTTFNINRLGLLLKRYFTENKQRELMYWGIITSIFIVIRDQPFMPITTIWYITGIVFSSQIFKTFYYTPGGMHYLLIPATHLEKLVSSLIINILYFGIMFLACYSVGNIVGTYLINTLGGYNYPLSWIFLDYVLEDGLLPFVLSLSIYTLGSVFFKQNALIKTSLAIIIFWIVLLIIELILLKYFSGNINLNFQIVNHSLLGSYGRITNIYLALKIILIPFFWLVTYFRLTEKEV
jgi:hypothetical protein